MSAKTVKKDLEACSVMQLIGIREHSVRVYELGELLVQTIFRFFLFAVRT